MKPITKEWLDRAKEDLDASLAIIPNEHLTNIVAFHSQQAVDIDFIKRLDEVYISTRYPSDLGLIPSGKPSMQDAKELYKTIPIPM